MGETLLPRLRPLSRLSAMELFFLPLRAASMNNKNAPSFTAGFARLVDSEENDNRETHTQPHERSCTTCEKPNPFLYPFPFMQSALTVVVVVEIPLFFHPQWRIQPAPPSAGGQREKESKGELHAFGCFEIRREALELDQLELHGTRRCVLCVGSGERDLTFHDMRVNFRASE